jgi:ubiquinone/menaquinone biosynthesis C-methylase UbiE
MANKQPSIFDVYAHEYDLITNAAQREKYHAREVTAIIERFRPNRVLDAGCASGLTTLLFARAGVEAVGIDRSKPILKTARETRWQPDLPIEFKYASFERLPQSMNQSFNLVVCLANAISGVDTIANLNRTLRNFHRVLRPGGQLVLQMLNYAAIKENTLFPIKATENSGIVYERFSERQGRSLFIYASRADFTQDPPKFEIFRHRFDNFEVEQVHRSMQRAGFAHIHKFGDLLFTRRFGKRSRDLVITGRRPS